MLLEFIKALAAAAKAFMNSSFENLFPPAGGSPRLAI